MSDEDQIPSRDDEIRTGIVTDQIYVAGEHVRWRPEFADTEVRIREQLHDPLDADREPETAGHTYEVVAVDDDGWLLLRDGDDVEQGEAAAGAASLPGLAPSYFILADKCRRHVLDSSGARCARCDSKVRAKG